MKRADGLLAARQRLADMVAAMPAHDRLAQAHRAQVLAWIDSGAELWRTAKPDVPKTHLVSYFVLRDRDSDRLLLVEHRGAGLLLPTGGHVEPGEDPWDTVIREAAEELRHPIGTARQVPSFLTVTETRGAGTHRDVSLWFTVDVDMTAIDWYDPGEFSGAHWLTPVQIRALPTGRLDPHMGRYLDVVER
jgi:8-oxo-dGTP diphosphatase